MKIYEATLEDLPDIHRLQQAWHDEKITLGFQGYPNNLLRAFLGPFFLLAKEKGAILAYILGEKKQAEPSTINSQGVPYLEINDLYVHKEFRGRKIGKALIGTLEQRARQAGLSQIQLYSANKDLVRTFQFYAALGFHSWYLRMYKNLE